MGRRPDAIYLPDGRRLNGLQEWAKEMALTLPNLAKLLGRLATDKRVPARAKRLAGMVAAYLVSPIDLFPDFIPVIGKTDDLLVAAFALNHLIREAGEDVVREHWDGSGEVLDMLIDVTSVVSGLVPGPVRLALSRLGRMGGQW
jgi:uncharacterized membrane protein YkvA (DUF1232 family)